MCLHCIDKVSNCFIKSCGRSWSAHKGTINAYTKAIQGNYCLKFSQLSFCQNNISFNQTPSCICKMCLHCIGKVSNCSIKSCSRSWSAHESTIYLCIYKSLIREELSKFSQLSFCQKIFILNQTPSCICSMCLHCKGKVSSCSIKSCGRSWSAHEGTIYAYTNTLLGKNCLSFHCCHLSIFFSKANSFMHMFNVSKLYRQSIKLFH